MKRNNPYVESAHCDLGFHKLKFILIIPEVMAFTNDLDYYI